MIATRANTPSRTTELPVTNEYESGDISPTECVDLDPDDDPDITILDFIDAAINIHHKNPADFCGGATGFI